MYRIRPATADDLEPMRDVLRAKGYSVHYVEIDGGHNHESWRATLADGLLALAAPK